MVLRYETGKSYGSDYLKLLSSELWHHVVFYMASNVLDELAASIFNLYVNVAADRFSEILGTIYQTTWCHVPRILKS